MKEGGGKRKGASFERQICKLLDEWWGEKDAFWRTPCSGARGTVSGVIHHFGDITAPGNSTGTLLLDKVTIELKTGYGKMWGPLDLLEGSPKTFFDFLEQAITDQKKAEREAFWLIFKRHLKKPYICMPYSFFKEYWSIKIKEPFAIVHYKKEAYFIMRLDVFFKTYSPKVFHDNRNSSS